MGELEQAGMNGIELLSVLYRILNEFEVGVVSDELNRELENYGRPDDGQIHTPDGFFFINIHVGREAAQIHLSTLRHYRRNSA